MEENKYTPEQELNAAYDAIVKVEYMVKTSTFAGDAAHKVAGALDLLSTMRKDVITKYKELVANGQEDQEQNTDLSNPAAIELRESTTE